MNKHLLVNDFIMQNSKKSNTDNVYIVTINCHPLRYMQES